MDNETNQVESIEEVNMDLGFEGMDDFDSFENEPEEPTYKAKDEEVEETEEESEETTKEEVEEETEETEEEETTIETLEDLEVKFLHDSKKLGDIPREELKTYIQKGMNHDRIQERLTVSNEQNDDFKEIANMFDMDLTQLTDSLKDQFFQDKAEKESRNINDVKTEYESNRKSAIEKMTNRFVDKYPDVPVDKLPQEVTDMAAQGKDLVDAFESYTKDADIKAKADEIEALNAKIKALEKGDAVKKQNAKIKKKGVVKSAQGSDDVQNDDFLDGLLGDY